MKPPLDRCVVLHSSHQRIDLDPVLGIVSDSMDALPFTPGAGLILRVGIHPRLHVPVYDLYAECPTLTSPGFGEFLDLSTPVIDLESRLQSEQLRIAASCREVAAACLAQAERLESLACAGCAGTKQIADYDPERWAGASSTSSMSSADPVSVSTLEATNVIQPVSGPNTSRLASLFAKRA